MYVVSVGFGLSGKAKLRGMAAGEHEVKVLVGVGLVSGAV
jgi:hypothetical protein